MPHKLIGALLNALEKTLSSLDDNEPKPQPEPQPEPKLKNIVDIAVSSEPLSTLVSLLGSFDLVDAVKNSEGVTVFAPTNRAFEQIKEVIPTLSRDQIKDILLSHVVPQKIKVAKKEDPKPPCYKRGHGDDDNKDIMCPGDSDCEDISTLGSLKLKVKKGETSKFVVEAPGSKANILFENIEASNGIVHVIDAVLLPAPKKEEEEDESLDDLLRKLLKLLM